MPKLIYLDFDGTLFTAPEKEGRQYPEMGEPRMAVIRAAMHEQKQGAHLILYTLRTGQALRDAEQALYDLGLVLYGVAPGKPFYDEIWEDRSRHPDDIECS